MACLAPAKEQAPLLPATAPLPFVRVEAHAACCVLAAAAALGAYAACEDARAALGAAYLALASAHLAAAAQYSTPAPDRPPYHLPGVAPFLVQSTVLGAFAVACVLSAPSAAAMIGVIALCAAGSLAVTYLFIRAQRAVVRRWWRPNDRAGLLAAHLALVAVAAASAAVSMFNRALSARALVGASLLANFVALFAVETFGNLYDATLGRRLWPAYALLGTAAYAYAVACAADVYGSLAWAAGSAAWLMYKC